VARLRRIHLASVGHKDARFFPVTIDLRDEFGSGSDAVLWLRNGGGKSSVLNLYFSIFQPRLTRFLGAKAEHRERSLTDYVKAEDIAFIISEWDIDPGIADPARKNVRIVGQVMAWKGRRLSTKATDLERWFFSCLAREGTTLESLPILRAPALGQSIRHVKSLQEFRDWFAEKAKTHPGGDFFISDHQGRWIEFLEKRDLDPEVFSYQLKMNQREGGAADLFKIDTAFDFVDLFLEIAFDPEKANLLATNLRTHREQLNRLPALNLELDFLAAARSELESFASHNRELHKAEEAHAEQVRQAQRVHGALCASIARKTALKSADEEKQEALKKQRNDKANEAERYRKYSEGYHRVHLKLAHDEAEAHAETCRVALRRAEEESAICKAAALLKKLKSREAEIAALQEQKALADEKRRPAEESLKPLGAVFRVLLQNDVAILDERATAQAKVRTDVEAESRAAGLQRDAMIRRQSEIETRVRELKQSITTHNTRREELIDRGELLPRESATDAIKRWQGEQQNATKRASEVAEEHAVISGEVESLTDTINAETGEIGRLEERLKGDELVVEEGSRKLVSLKVDAILREAIESDDPDVDFPDLPERLATMRHRTQAALIDLKLEGAEDEHSKQWVEEHSLLPPAREVAKLIQTLHADGAKSAVSAYKFLADNLSPSQALACIASDPARFSGAMLQSTDEFDTLRAKPFPANDGLRQPVVVSLTGRHDAPAANDRVVLPVAPGCYSYPEAQAALPAIQARHDERRKHAENLNRRLHEIEAAANLLKSFRESFGGGKLRALQQSLETAKRALEIRRSQLSETKAVRDEKRTHMAALTREAAALQQTISSTEKALVKLANFRRDYGEPFPAWESEHRVLQVEAQQVETQLLEITGRLEHLAAVARAATDRIHELSSEKNGFEKELGAIRFDTGAISPALEGVVLEQARSRYETAVQQFDRQFGNDQISGQIIQLEKERVAEESAFRAAAKNCDGQQVGDAAAQPGLSVRANEADAAVRAMTDALTLARHKVTVAQENLPGPQSYKSGADLPPGEVEPATADEALKKADTMKARKGEVDKGLTDLSSRIDDLKTALAALQASLTMRGALRESVKEYAASGEQDDILPESDEDASTVIGELRDRLADTTRERNAWSAKLDALFSKFRRAIHDERFITVQPTYKTKMANLERDELRKECDSYLLQIDARQTIIRKDIEQCRGHKKIIVSNLEAVSREVASLLRRAQRESMLPTTLKGWAEQPFLRVHFELPEDSVEMQVKLDFLVEKLVRDEIPTGLRLACLAFHEVAPNVRVTLLKPESNLRPDRHEITAFGGFSGGEKLTAAILLYCTLVRLRSQSRGWMKTNSSAGVLILDNPVGISSKEDFIRLQLDLARQMGVQLLYTTGVNDLGALSVLPLIVRLRNQTRDRVSGDLLVTEESMTLMNAESIVEGVRVAWRS